MSDTVAADATWLTEDDLSRSALTFVVPGFEVDATWLTEDDLNLLVTLADLAEEFSVTWSALADTRPFPDTARHLDELAAEIAPLLTDYRRRFPQTNPDERIPAIVSLAAFLPFGPQGNAYDQTNNGASQPV